VELSFIALAIVEMGGVGQMGWSVVTTMHRQLPLIYLWVEKHRAIRDYRNIQYQGYDSVMGIFGLFFRLLNGGRAPERRRRAVIQYEVISTEVQSILRPSSHAQIPTHSVPIVTTVTGPCYVIDGDTIVIDRRHIRLAGIDAPELDHPWGKNAKWALIGLCKGQVIRAEFDGSLTHDRNVATCYLPDGRDLSAEMVKAGFAIDWAKHSGGKYRMFEHEGIRRKFWRADARQKGRFPPPQQP
jgi:endonuclease YncB( thermonuclease family)